MIFRLTTSNVGLNGVENERNAFASSELLQDPEMHLLFLELSLIIKG